jgi:hypothetical protein
MRWNDGLNVAFLQLLNFEKHFVQETSSNVAGENWQHKFLPVQRSQFLWDNLAKLDNLFTLEMRLVVLADFLKLILTQTVHNFRWHLFRNLRNEQVQVINSMNFFKNLPSIFHKSFLIDIHDQVVIESMRADNLKCLPVKFLFHFIFDFCDHEKFRVNGLKIASGELEDYSSFGAGDDRGPSFNVSDVKELLLNKFLNFFLELTPIHRLIPQPPVQLKVKDKEPVVHVISRHSIKQELMVKDARQTVIRNGLVVDGQSGICLNACQLSLLWFVFVERNVELVDSFWVFGRWRFLLSEDLVVDFAVKVTVCHELQRLALVAGEQDAVKQLLLSVLPALNDLVFCVLIKLEILQSYQQNPVPVDRMSHNNVSCIHCVQRVWRWDEGFWIVADFSHVRINAVNQRKWVRFLFGFAQPFVAAQFNCPVDHSQTIDLGQKHLVVPCLKTHHFLFSRQ